MMKKTDGIISASRYMLKLITKLFWIAIKTH